MKTTALAKGDTLAMREAISEAILNSQINKPTNITEEVDEVVLDYSQRLKNFNFGHDILDEVEDKQRDIQSQKEQNKLLNTVNKHYSELYPNNVIIPLSDLTKILKKYDLYSSSTRFYTKKLIPQKNLAEMEKFWENADKSAFANFDLNNLSDLTLTSMTDITRNHQRESILNVLVDRKSLQIIAPLNEFGLGKEEKVIGNFIVHDKEWDAKNIKKPVPLNLDPIVWIPLKYPTVGGAALIITQWGPEADIPEFN